MYLSSAWRWGFWSTVIRAAFSNRSIAASHDKAYLCSEVRGRGSLDNAQKMFAANSSTHHNAFIENDKPTTPIEAYGEEIAHHHS